MSKFYIVVILLICTGCTKFNEVHYFKDKAGTPPNYYRLTLRGTTFITSSRYITGYFDEKAVEAYFNEISQPSDGNSKAVLFKSNNQEGSGNGVEPLAAKLRGKSFVMILSTNSDAIANAIGAFAGSQQTLTAIAGLINRDRIIDASEIGMKLKAQEVRNDTLANLGTQLIENLPDTAGKEQTEAAFLQYANALAAKLGNQVPFTSLKKVAEWLEVNRSSIMR